MNAWGTLYLDYVEPTLLVAVINGRGTYVLHGEGINVPADASRGGRFAAAYNDWERSKALMADMLLRTFGCIDAPI